MHISAPPAARPVGPGKFGDRDRGPRAGGCGAVRAGGAARLGADLRVYIWVPPGRHRRPRRHRTRKRTVGAGGAGVVCERDGGAARVGAGATRRRMQRHASRHRRPRDPQRARAQRGALSRLRAGPVRNLQEAGRSCATRNGSDLRAYNDSTSVLSNGRAAQCPRLPRDPRRAGRRSISRRIDFAATEAPTSEHQTQYEKPETLRTLVQIQQCFYWFIFNKDNHIFDLGNLAEEFKHEIKAC